MRRRSRIKKGIEKGIKREIKKGIFTSAKTFVNRDSNLQFVNSSCCWSGSDCYFNVSFPPQTLHKLNYNLTVSARVAEHIVTLLIPRTVTGLFATRAETVEGSTEVSLG